MARPTKRDPRENLSAPEPARPLTPAPDNGATFGTKPATASASRRGRQLGQRIPEELYERLVACSKATDIPMGKLIVRGLEAELERHQF